MRFYLPWLFVVPVCAGCQLVFGYDDFSAAEAREPHSCDALPESKIDERGLAAMSRVDLTGGNCVWIDRDEVSVDQYNQWLLAGTEDTVWDANYCGWKQAASTPQAEDDPCGAQLRKVEPQPFAARKPARCVDFCDADAFCRWASKRLCYDRASTGTQEPQSVAREWTQACTNGLRTVYPWGDEPPKRWTCNLDSNVEGDRISTVAIATGTSAGCSNERGVSDLLGNVAEWTYGCNVSSGTEDQAVPCQVKGGGYDEPPSTCNADDITDNDTRRPNLGFRCCAPLTASERVLVDDNP